jgi:glycosyltransferase involved in cell wall biosynthesis
LRVLMVGTRFFSTAHAGDKTFWLGLCSGVAAAGDSVHVVSVDRRAVPAASIAERFDIETVQAIPVYFRLGPHRERYNEAAAHIQAITNYASRSVTLPRLFRRLRQLVVEWTPDVVHFMDNLGPAMPIFLRGFPRPAFVSTITYDPRSLAYDGLLRMSLGAYTGVAATSDAFTQRLRAIGVPPARVSTIRWGVDSTRIRPSTDLEGFRERLGFDRSGPLVCWSGYLQQTTQNDFFVAYRAAIEALKRDRRVRFLFCLKPQHFREPYRQMERAGIRVVGDPQAFALGLNAMDVFLNPVTRTDSILAPPLTWVECMMRGIPVITTPCGGVDEALGSGRGGLVLPGAELGPGLVELLQDPARLASLRRSTREWAETHYSLAESVRRYRGLWSAAGDPSGCPRSEPEPGAGSGVGCADPLPNRRLTTRPEVTGIDSPDVAPRGGWSHRVPQG